ncbi:MAG: EamA family transporter [Armatimonadetes bacterium]|nr:EamA family transporter [Armatimonadota bacterium]
MAITIWSTSPLVTRLAVHESPPLVALALTFSVAAVLGITYDAGRRRLRQVLRAPRRVVLLGLLGMGSYHLAYYLAFFLAPPIEVSLLNYLWPLLTVLLSAPLLGEPLPKRTAAAAMLALLGAGLVVTQGQLPRLSTEHAAGYALALHAGVSWAVFSCLLRRYGAVAQGRMTLFSLLTALLAWTAAGLLHQPLEFGGWAATLYLGVGPMFIAFRCWDRAVAVGDVARIGLVSYLTPVLATSWLALAGAPLSPASLAGMALIVIAAVAGGRSSNRTPNTKTKLA